MPPSKSKVWSKDWFTGLAYFAFFLLFAYGAAPDSFYSLETAKSRLTKKMLLLK